MIKLKLQYFWLPDVKSQLVGKDPKAGKDWRQEEEGTTEDEMDDGIIDSLDMNLYKLWEDSEGQGSLACRIHGVAKSRTRLNNWMTATTFNQSVKKMKVG